MDTLATSAWMLLTYVAHENEVILFCLPPHTTHALQPLDASVFKSLKSHFGETVHALSLAKKDFVFSKCGFACAIKTQFLWPTLRQALLKLM